MKSPLALRHVALEEQVQLIKMSLGNDASIYGRDGRRPFGVADRLIRIGTVA